MENLWSTWRSQYIESFNEARPKVEGCVFCATDSQNVEDLNNLVVRKSKYTFTILNLYPYNNGHLMVVPYRHICNFLELTPEENAEIMAELQLAVKALKKISNPEGFNIGANIGKVSGAGIDTHMHFHIVPRWNGDTNFMPVLGEVKILSQDLQNTKIRLLQAYAELD